MTESMRDMVASRYRTLPSNDCFEGEQRVTTMRQRKRSFCALWLLGLGHSHVWFRSFDGLTRSGKPAPAWHLHRHRSLIDHRESKE